MDANSKQTKLRAEQIAKEQLKNRYWLIFFEDSTSQTVWSRHNFVKLDLTSCLYVEERVNFLTVDKFSIVCFVLTEIKRKLYFDLSALFRREVSSMSSTRTRIREPIHFTGGGQCWLSDTNLFAKKKRQARAFKILMPIETKFFSLLYKEPIQTLLSTMMSAKYY